MRRFKMFFIDLFQLRCWGEKGEVLLTRRGENYLLFTAIMLLLAACFELFAWFQGWMYSLENTSLALMMAIIFTMAVVIYDRNLLTADTRLARNPNAGIRIPWLGWRIGVSRFGGSMLLRLFFLLMIAYINAIPFELRFFRNEIEHRLDQTENASVDQIRARAVESERNRLERELSVTQTRANGSLETLRAQQTAARQALERAQGDQRQQMQQGVDRTADQAIDEVRNGGRGRGRARGAGTVYDSLMSQRAQQNAELGRFNQGSQDALRSLDQQHGQVLRAEQERLQSQVDDQRGAVERRLSEIRTMPRERLAAEFGGQYTQPRGFLARLNVLNAMQRESADVREKVLGLRLVIMLFGLLFLGLKLMMPDCLQKYFSLGEQAAVGNPEAQRHVEIMGYTDFSKFAMSPEKRDLTTDFYKICYEAHAKLIDFERFTFEVASRKDGAGTYLKFSEISAGLRRQWIDETQPAINKLAAHTHLMQELGAMPPSWPLELNGGIDPRGIQFRPWEVTPALLTTRFGWMDPEPETKRLEGVRDTLLNLRRDLARIVAEARQSFIELAAGRKTLLEMKRERIQLWRDKVVPILDKMSRCEEELRRSNRVIPPWSPEIPDPREGLEDRICEIDKAELDRLGWVVLPPLPVTN